MVCPGESITRPEADVVCSNIGGIIGLPIDATMNSLVYNLHNSYTWIDLTDEGHEGTWTDSSGNTPDFIGWGVGYPNGGNFVYQGGNGVWDDTDTDAYGIYCALCEKGKLSPIIFCNRVFLIENYICGKLILIISYSCYSKPSQDSFLGYIATALYFFFSRKSKFCSFHVVFKCSFQIEMTA